MDEWEPGAGGYTREEIRETSAVLNGVGRVEVGRKRGKWSSGNGSGLGKRRCIDGPHVAKSLAWGRSSVLNMP